MADKETPLRGSRAGAGAEKEKRRSMLEQDLTMQRVRAMRAIGEGGGRPASRTEGPTTAITGSAIHQHSFLQAAGDKNRIQRLLGKTDGFWIR